MISGRRADRIEALKAEIGGDRVHAFTLDVQDAAAVKAAVDGLPAAFAEVDVLVNNAGLALGLGPAQTADLADWDTMIDTNVKGWSTAPGRSCPAWLPATAATSSISARWPAPIPIPVPTSMVPPRPS